MDSSHPGKHEAIITFDQFERVQSLIGRPLQPRPQKKIAPFTGMIRCGACGFAVTIERHVNRYGRPYTYYHCTGRNRRPKCPQPSIQAPALEAQIIGFIESLALPQGQHEWALRQIAGLQSSCRLDHEQRLHALGRAVTDVSRSLDALTDLRVRGMIGDDEFIAKRRELQEQQMRSRSALARAETEGESIEPVADFISFSNRAIDWFQAGDERIKRMIFEIIGSNPTITDKILNVEAKKPFTQRPNGDGILNVCGLVQNIRALRSTPEFEKMLENIKYVQKHFNDASDQKAA